MVTITESACEAIKGLMAAVSPSRHAGVRIGGSPPEEGPRYDLEVRPGPDPGDQVLVQRGVRVFADPQTADELDGKTLDASVRKGVLRFQVED
jgi:iron-sulfur cluster assembly protein